MARALPTAATVRELRAAGVTRGQLQNPSVRRLLRGLVTPLPVDCALTEQVAGVLRLLPPETVATGVTALAMHGAPVRSSRLQFATTWPHHVRRIGLRVSRVVELPTQHGLRADVVPAFVVAAGELDLVDLVAAGDHVVRHEIIALEALLAGVADATGRGCVLARRAAVLVRERVDSPRETWLRLCLVLAELPEPEVNIRIGNDAGYLGRPDLTYRRYRTLLEYEGDQHRADRRQWVYDMLRYEDFAADGWTTLRIAGEMTRRPRDLVRRTYRAIRAAGYDGPEPRFGPEWCRLFERVRS